MRRDTTPEEEAERLMRVVEEKGFKAVKVKVGNPFGFDKDAAPGRSESVVREVREKLGDEIEIMVDANGGFAAPKAIQLGRKMEKYDIFHFEEPCPYYDIDSTAKVAKALDVPVAGGEQDWSIYRFKEMLEKEAVDIVQPDLIKAGASRHVRRLQL